MRTLTCPFCNNELELKRDGTYRCENCKLTVDDGRYSATFDNDAPEYLLETFEFLRECEDAQPRYCLSRVDMWQPGFRLDTVIMSGKANAVPTKSMSDGKWNVGMVDGDGYKLIAGRGVYVDMILYMFMQVMSGDVSYCGFGTRAFSNAEYQLYFKVTKYAESRMPDEEQMRVINSFFAPNLESMLYWNNKMWQANVQLMDLTTEQMLYSLIFCNPVKRIGIAGNVKANIGSFIYRTLLKYRNEPSGNPLGAQFTKLRELGFDEEYVEEFAKLCLMANPYTYINCSETFDASSLFDAMYGEYVDDMFCGFDIAELTVNYVEGIKRLYQRLAFLTNKYAAESKCLGLSFKQEHVIEDKSTVDATVLEFWREVRDYLN